MGVSLNFVTTAPVPETVRRAIESDAEGQLARWSREHDLEWELRCEGEFVGRVKYGAADQAALDFLAAMISGDPGPPESRPARMQQIAARYADRW